MKTPLTLSFLLPLAILLLIACGGETAAREDSSVPIDAATDTGTDGAAACEANPDGTIDGVALPLADMQLRNAFDPSDETIYDPNDPAALVAPVMVDTWGERSSGAHGTIGVFPPGFSAPLHTHSNDYFGVVLRGEMTNPFGTNLERFLDDDDSNNHGTTTLSAGSHWYVPAGSQHTTTCLGPEVCWFYFHSENLFDFAPIIDETGQLAEGVTLEAPHADAVLLPNADLNFVEAAPFVSFAAAFGNMGPDAHGTFGRFNAGAASPTHVHGAEYHGVVISGELSNPFNGEDNPPGLGRGSFWSVPGDSVHVTACADGEDCLFYFHQRTGFDFTPLCEQP